MKTLYLTIAVYDSDGAQRDFAVPFPYIKKEYVKAYSQAPNAMGAFTGEMLPLEYEWLNDGMIRLPEAVQVGHRLYVRRETYADTPLIDFQDAAILIEEDLDLAGLQALHVAQEAKDANGLNLADVAGRIESATEATVELIKTVAQDASGAREHADRARVEADRANVEADRAKTGADRSAASTARAESAAVRAEEAAEQAEAVGEALDVEALLGAVDARLLDKAPLASPALTGTPTINGSALAGMALVAPPAADGKAYAFKNGAWVEVGGGGGAIAGEIRLLPFRKTELPAGWYYPSGDYVAQSSEVGAALMALPTNFKADWGIIVSGSNVRLCDPNKFFSSTLGRFFRPVDGTSRQAGSTEDDAIRNITGAFSPYGNMGPIGPAFGSLTAGTVSGAFKKGASTTFYPGYGTSGPGTALLFDASESVATASENRPYNVGMTPAIYLGV